MGGTNIPVRGEPESAAIIRALALGRSIPRTHLGNGGHTRARSGRVPTVEDWSGD
jgi:hypothetical protein